MSYPVIFSLAIVPVLPLWALMIVAPGWAWTRRIVTQPWSYAPLAVVYLVLVALNAADVVPAIVDNPRLETVGPLLATTAGATIAWVHFLTFDVFVGRWIYLDARAAGRSPWLMAPILLLTFLFGPAGFLAYLCLRAVRPESYASPHG
jgi:hypothetical protein